MAGYGLVTKQEVQPEKILVPFKTTQLSITDVP